MKKRLLSFLIVMFAVLMPTELWAQEPYAVLSEDSVGSMTLTFYYDMDKASHNGLDVGPFDYGSLDSGRGWDDVCNKIQKVVFDPSFANCTSITSTAIWFDHCSNLSVIEGIENLNVSNVTDMNSMFNGCSSLTSLNLSTFVTEKVSNMRNLFNGCSNLTSLNVNNFNTSNVIATIQMFLGCSSLETLDLSSFNTGKVSNMSEMFRGCSSLKTIYVGSEWSTSGIKSDGYGSGVFSDCTNLVGGAGTTYNYNHVDYTYAHIDGGTSNPGYFTAKDAKVWSVIGTINGEWDTDTEMTSEDGVNYRASFPYMAAGKYEFKIRANGDWAENYGADGKQDGSNVVATVEEDLSGVIVMFNAETKEITYSIMPPVYSVTGSKVDEDGNSISGWLNWADDADMTKDENGIYSVTFDNMAVGYYSFKVRVNHEWTYNWGADGELGGANMLLTIAQAGPVTIYFDPETHLASTAYPQKLEQVATPTFSWNEDMLTMSTETEGAVIRYTDSNVNPVIVEGEDEAITQVFNYTEPISITQNTELQIWAEKEGMKKSEVVILDYPYTAWRDLRDAEDKGQSVIMENAGNDKVPEKLLDELKYYMDEAHQMYVQRTAERASIEDMTAKLLSLIEDVLAMASAEDIIQFADSVAKTICVANWDTNGDGELSMSEAAAVTSLGVMFKNNYSINSFDEFQYFTGVTSIDDDAFRYCSRLNSIKLPTNLNTIGSNAFNGCPLSSIDFPESLNTIGDYAFISTNITSVFITQGVVSLGINPFEYCPYIESIVVDEQNPVYDSRNQCNGIIESSSNKLIIGCKKTVIPEGIVTIGKNAFISCVFDSHPSFPSTLKNIEEHAFYNSTGLTHLVLTDGIENLGYYAFASCGIEELTLPSTLKEILGECFNYNNLRSIRIPASVNYIAAGAFSSNSELEEIVVEEGNQVYTSNNCNVIFNPSTGLLVQASNNFVFPDGVKSLGWDSFKGLAHVTKVDIPEGVTDLGDYTFYPCRALEELTIPSTISSDGIHDLTFYDCTGLKVIRCYIKSPSPLSSKYTGPFGSNGDDVDVTYKQAALYVPYGTKALYESTDGWNKFQNIIEMEPDVDYSFDYNGVLWVDSDVTMAQVMEEASQKHNVAEHITAIVWHSSQPLTNSDLQVFDNPNMLIYVDSDSLAPQNRNNVVVGDFAKNIVLTDVASGNGSFYCPQAFTAEMISYTHEYKQKTEVGVSRGWETIALPFDVQTVMHEKNGLIAPFGNSTSDKHFWLRQLTHQGLEQATAIQANWPYLISMPNSETYTSSYNLAGRVTFSAQNVVVPETEEYGMDMYSEEGGMVMMRATFSGVSKSAGVYALNVGEARGNNPEGSVFEVNYRDIRPFEAYTMHEGNGPAPQFIPVAGFIAGEATGIEDVRSLMSDGSGETWYDLNGRKLLQKPIKKGVYLNNGLKVVIK